MPELIIEFTRRTDGDVILRCTRADGTATWQRVEGRQAAFFPHHDLTHYAVETELSFREGFFGLIAAGWDVADTGGKGRRGRLPREATLVEWLVGAFDLERAAGVPWSAEDFNTHLATAGSEPSGATSPRLSEEALERVRDRRRQLFAAWAAVLPGATLELRFDRP